jgi:hypothetical protein
VSFVGPGRRASLGPDKRINRRRERENKNKNKREREDIYTRIVLGYKGACVCVCEYKKGEKEKK